MFLLFKNGKTTSSPSVLCRTEDHRLCVWNSEDSANEYASRNSFDRWCVRPATSNDFAMVGRMKKNRFNQTRNPYVVMDREKTEMAKKTTSAGCLVDVFEDLENRKFAISSKAKDENEFITELSNALGQASTGDLTMRMRELLPLIVDMCCKYRGYKAETVHERRELVAGDLEMPRN